MHAVVLTFPGHVFQTLLCVRSIQQHFPMVDHFSFVLDDVEQAPWHNFVQDFVHQINAVSALPFDVYQISQMPGIKTCVAGWWRQQLVKCCLDQIVPGHEWLVVDGDCVFLTPCHVRKQIPVTRRHDRHSRFSTMAKNYVRRLLGTSQGHLEQDGEWVCTNAVPFRLLDRTLLTHMRDHVEAVCHGDFLQLHLDWFQDQSIVADHDPPDRMCMSEWELIECFRRYVQGHAWPFREVGSGYSIHYEREDIPQQQDVFLHAYQWDCEIGRARFDTMQMAMSDAVWQCSEQWYQYQRAKGNRA